MATAEPTALIVLITVLGTGLPALLYTVWRGKWTGPKEADDLVARASREAVEAMRASLTAAIEERESTQERISLLESTLDAERETWERERSAWRVEREELRERVGKLSRVVEALRNGGSEALTIEED